MIYGYLWWPFGQFSRTLCDALLWPDFGFSKGPCDTWLPNSSIYYSTRSDWWGRHVCHKQGWEWHFQEKDQQLFVCKAEDIIERWSLTFKEYYGITNWMHSNPYEIDGKKKKWHYLLDKIEIAIGMKVMVTQNVQTDLDITSDWHR